MFKKKSSRRLIFSSLCMVVFMAGGIRYLAYDSSIIRTTVSVVVHPFLIVQHYVVQSIAEYRGAKKTMAQLELELSSLKGERDQLIADNIALLGMIDYSSRVCEMVSYNERYETDRFSIAQIILKNFTENQHSFLVDKGARHGIVQDMVATYQNCLVGRVVEVFPFYSKILLITDRNCKVAAQATQSQASGIHLGRNRLDVSSLVRVSHMQKIALADIILSSGEGLIFPQGFALGRVSSVEKDGLYYQIELAPLVDFSTLSYCTLQHKGDCGIKAVSPETTSAAL